MNIFISDKTSTKNALAKMNKFGGRSLIVVKNKILAGVLTSGDLRKAIIDKKFQIKILNLYITKKLNIFSKMK